MAETPAVRILGRLAASAMVFAVAVLFAYAGVGLAASMGLEGARQQANHARVRAEAAVNASAALTNEVQFLTAPTTIARWASSSHMVDGGATPVRPAVKMPKRVGGDDRVALR